MRKTAMVGPILMLCLSFLPRSGGAQPAADGGNLTLPRAQKEALEHSPAYQKALAQDRAASWGQVEALSEGFLPHVTVKGQHFFDVNYSTLNVEFGTPSPVVFPGIYPKTTLSLDADFDLFDGFRNVHRLDAANNDRRAARILSGFSLLSLEEQVRIKFYQALAARMLSDMADQNVKTLEDHRRIVEDQLENGQATKYDVLRVEVQLSEARSDKLQADDNVALARESLAQAMGTAGDDRPLRGTLPELDVEAILKEVSGMDIGQSPELRVKEFQARAAQDQSAASHGFWFPKVSLIGEYQWYNSPDYLLTGVTDSNDFRTDYFIGATATWDILDGGLSLAKANQASEQAQEAQADYRAAELQAPYDFDLWKRKLVSSMSLYRAKQTDVEKAKESARLATVGFEAGTRTTTDVLDAELEEYRASAGLVQSQVDALEALMNLELVTGKRLFHD
jgi:outer membrane protein